MAPKTKKTKKVKKVKIKVPKIHVTSSGRKYINIGKKRVYLAHDVTANQLLKFILSRVLKKPKQRKTTSEKVESKRTIHIARPTSTVTSGDDRVAKILEEQKRDLERKEYEQKLKKKIDDEIVAKFKEPKHKLLKAGDDEDIDIPDVFHPVIDVKDVRRKGMYAELSPLQQPKRERASSDGDVKTMSARKRGDIEQEVINIGKDQLFRTRLATLKWKDVKAMAVKNKIPWQQRNKKGGLSQRPQEDVVQELVKAGVIDKKKWVNDIENELVIKAVAELEKGKDGLEFDDAGTPPPPMVPVTPPPKSQSKILFAFTPEQRKELLDDGLSDEVIERLAQGGQGQKDSGGLYTSQIDAMMASHRPNYLGCFARDQLGAAARLVNKQTSAESAGPLRMRKFGFIQNTDTSKQKGTHWVAWFFDRDAKTIEYYNSLADPITKPMMESIKPITNKLKKLDGDHTYQFKYNLVRDQHLKSSTCGWFCIVFLRDRFNGIPFKIASKYTSEKRIKSVIQNMKHEFPQIGLEGQGWKEMLSKAWDAAKYVGKKVLQVGKTVLNTKPREGWSPSIRKLLEKHGAKNITEITLYRQPIQSFVSKALNWVTLGKFSENIKAAGYDSALHLYLSFTLEDGTSIRFDKNHVVEASLGKGTAGAETMPVKVKNTPLNDFLNKGIDHVGKEKYFTYDSRTQNCQYWVIWNLQANGLLTDSIKKWVLQDADAIYKKLGLLEKVNRGITDIAAKADTALYGEGRGKLNKGVVLPI